MNTPLIRVALVAVCLTGEAALAQQAAPVVIHPSAYDTSLPLRDVVASAPAEAPVNPHVTPLRIPPRSPAAAGPVEDPVLQALPSPSHHTKPNLHVLGTGADGVAPPDTNGSVGLTQYVQIVNVEYAVYNKSGGLIMGPTPIHNIWSGFGGDCANGDGGDPVVVYDKAANRWVVGQLNANFNAYCMAVSTSSDATGSYNRYEYSFGSNLPDYPKLGVWPDAYYFTSNIFIGGSFFGGPSPCAIDRTAMLNGNAANMICPSLSQSAASEASFLPSDLDGSTPPPAGSPNFYLTLWNSTTLHLYKFHVDFVTPANSTFTGPTAITVASYSQACGGDATCIPQKGTTQQLDSLGDRLMYRLAYRNFGDHEALVVNHSVTAGSSVGVRWYEIRNPNGAVNLFQQGTFAPDSNFRWMGSIAMDQAGDIAMGYSESSSNLFPSVYQTGRVPTDPANTMENETLIMAGVGSQTSGLSRWGDYSGMSIDPVDDCTFWYTNEFLPNNGTFNWSTAIGSFKFPSCGGPPPPPPPAPTGVTVTKDAYNEVDLSWANPSGSNATGNRVLRCAGTGCTPAIVIATLAATATSYNDTSVSSNTTYGYVIEAFNSGGAADSTPVAYALTPASPPPAPTLNSATVVSAGEIDLAWTNPVGSSATGNRVLKCSGTSCTPATVIATLAANATSYKDTSVSAGNTYGYLIQAFNTSGNANSNTRSATTPPPAPTLNSAAAVSATEVDLGWTNPIGSNATNNRVLRCTGASCTPTTVIATLAATAASYNDTSVSAGITYGYLIQAFNSGGNANSGSLYATTPTPPPPPDFAVSATPTPPTALVVHRGATGTYTVTINDINGSSSVNLSISGLPSRVSAGFSPSTVTGNGNSTLTVTVNRRASTVTNHTLTITGKNANFSHSTSVLLTIQ